ncbi:MAG: FecR family protein [Candidatus Electryoneaceae bacterium]|nr:FecR family protein [Candidatus Electryoneaceae bacterium]
MRKQYILAIIVLFVLSLSDQAISATGSRAIALALKVTGSVKITRDGNTTNLKFGTTLNHGDAIKTGRNGYVKIMFTDDKSIIKLKANTSIVIEGQRDTEGTVAKRVSVEIGALFARVDQQRGTLQIATPTSVASVKGTEFWVIVDENGNTYVVTLRGLVELMNRLTGEGIEVSEAQRGTIDADGNMHLEDVPPEDIPEEPNRDDNDAPLDSIEIEIEDGNGNTRTIQVQFTVTAPLAPADGPPPDEPPYEPPPEDEPREPREPRPNDDEPDEAI